MEKNSLPALNKKTATEKRCERLNFLLILNLPPFSKGVNLRRTRGGFFRRHNFPASTVPPDARLFPYPPFPKRVDPAVLRDGGIFRRHDFPASAALPDANWFPYPLSQRG